MCLNFLIALSKCGVVFINGAGLFLDAKLINLRDL